VNDSHDNGAAASARRIADELASRIDAIMRESTEAHEAGDTRLGVALGMLAAVLDDRSAVLAENETMRQQLARATQWCVFHSSGARTHYDSEGSARIAITSAQRTDPDAALMQRLRLVGEWQPAEGDE